MENIEELIDRLAVDVTPARSVPPPLKLSFKLAGATMAYLALSLAVSGLRPDMSAKLHEPWFMVEIVTLLLIFISTSLSAALLAFPDLHQRRGAAFAPAVMFMLFVPVIFFAWNADSPPAPLPMHSFECTFSIILVSLLPAAWTFYTIRQYASTHYRLAGSIALLSAFSVGALWLRLHEVNDSVTHLIQWHYLPMLVFGMIGLLLGRVLLKW